MILKQHHPVYVFLAIFCLLFMISFSFGYEILPDVTFVTGAVFQSLADNTALLFGNDPSPIISDSTGMFYNTLNIALISMLTLIVLFAAKVKLNKNFFSYWMVVILAYYLSLHLFMYGFSKVFKIQFFLPEPNTLYTIVGNTPRDLLYWSTMGLSRSYSIFMGSIEVISALLLLFRRTRLIGALLATGIMINVVAVNFGFDISVKVYSVFLLLISLLIATRYKDRLLLLIPDLKIKTQSIQYPIVQGRWHLIRSLAKAFIITIFLLEACYPAYQRNTLNDDNAKRPVHHGAYEVDSMTIDGIQRDCHFDQVWKRIFIHRANYLIVQQENERMTDFKILRLTYTYMLVNTHQQKPDTLYYTSEANNLKQVWGTIRGTRIDCQLTKLPVQDLPVLQNEFHWTID